MTDRKIDELILMRLEEDEIQACLEIVEKMREEKRLAAKRKEFEDILKTTAFGLAEVSSSADAKHFLRELARMLPND